MLLPAALCYSQGFTPSRAAYYATSDGYGTPSGACGYGYYGRSVNNGKVAAVSELWRNGAGCGACYQVRCKNSRLCNMGRNPSASAELKKYGVVDMEYWRVPCTNEGSSPNARIVYIDGAFDLFHAGHVEILRLARKLGDFLLIGIHTDRL
ncbi:hypothetical protein K1719_029362 [Acacia pycnantha]|nr:hypothetical protein K1719_029362 [Acacia pycnantha]